jgi:hypothetical protein
LPRALVRRSPRGIALPSPVRLAFIGVFMAVLGVSLLSYPLSVRVFLALNGLNFATSTFHATTAVMLHLVSG